MVQKGEESTPNRGGSTAKAKEREPRREVARLQRGKAVAAKFKKSCYGEENGVTSAIFLLACVVCSPPSPR
ncbi:unnamed protein product [Spirodela intermedia]|uniref:Uncharacterized protein n=1 Tax=Spirodela intermedia TaxID=51605 RepID=A0A7I8KDZ7_SPIIN|nr:unnamed protein product [Spirodela intermedia]